MVHKMEATIYEYMVITLGVHDVGMWDYKSSQQAEDILNNHGNAGWDLVSVVDNKAFFKRRIVVVEDE